MFRIKRITGSLSLRVFLAAIFLAACNAPEGILAHNAWMMPARESENGAVYFQLINHSSEGDLLTGATSDLANAVELDQATRNGDLIEMTPVEHILVPASTEVNFRPGALHVMLIRIKQDLELDDEIEITLHFLHAPDLIVNVSVRSFPPLDSDEHH